MLVLSRKAGQSIAIGNNVRITITRIAGDKVRIGIEAPADVAIVRTELGVRDPINPVVELTGKEVEAA